jgi:hypothetical protein
VEGFGGLCDGQPAEIPQLDDLAFSCIQDRQRLECLVERDDLATSLRRDDEGFVERNDRRATTTLLVLMGARRVDENPSHQASRQREEVRPVSPLDTFAVNEPDEDQGGP